MKDRNEKLLEQAERQGFSLSENNNGIFSVEKGNFHVWECYDTRTNRIWWQTAKLIKGYYRGHQKYWCFSEAITK